MQIEQIKTIRIEMHTLEANKLIQILEEVHRSDKAPEEIKAESIAIVNRIERVMNQ